MKRAERRILLRLLAVFLAFYIATMAIFTVIQFQAAARDAASFLYGQLLWASNRLEECLAEPKGGETMSLTEGMPPYESESTREVTALEVLDETGRFAPGVYTKSYLYKEGGEPWLRSGNHLFIWPFHGLKGMRRYIDLDDCMPPWQISDLSAEIGLARWSAPYEIGESDYDMNIRYDSWGLFEIRGFLTEEGTRAYPETIALKRYSGFFAPGVKDEVRDPPNEESEAEYAFPLPEIPMSDRRYFHYWDKTDVRLETAARKWKGGYVTRLWADARSQKRYALCGQMDSPWSDDAWTPQVSRQEVRRIGTRVRVDGLKAFTVDGVQYFLRMKTLCYPLEAAMPSLLPTYLFSLLMVFLLSGLLYWMLTRLSKRERALEVGRRGIMNAVAHDLKTPLGIIRAYSEGLREKIAEDKRDHYLEVIVDETARMDEMLRELLQLCKLESGTQPLQLTDCNVAAVLQGCVERYKGLQEAEKLEFSAVESFVVQADPARLEQVFSNLIANALRHTPAGKRVWVTLEGRRAAVENEGQPISEEQLGYIWDAFRCGDGEREREGAGLGLAIVRELLEQHHFLYGVENTEKGVSFWVEFPK